MYGLLSRLKLGITGLDIPVRCWDCPLWTEPVVGSHTTSKIEQCINLMDVRNSSPVRIIEVSLLVELYDPFRKFSSFKNWIENFL